MNIGNWSDPTAAFRGGPGADSLPQNPEGRRPWGSRVSKLNGFHMISQVISHGLILSAVWDFTKYVSHIGSTPESTHFPHVTQVFAHRQVTTSLSVPSKLRGNMDSPSDMTCLTGESWRKLEKVLTAHQNLGR